MPDTVNFSRVAAHNIPTPEHWILEYDQESNLEEGKGLSKHIDNFWPKTEWIEDLEMDSITCCFNQLENGPNLTHRSIRSVFNLPDDIQFFRQRI